VDRSSPKIRRIEAERPTLQRAMLRSPRPSLLALLAAVVLSLGSFGSAQTPTDSGSGPVRKKLIELGWGALTPARFQEHLAVVEQTPFDGMGLKITGTNDAGQPVGIFQVCIPKPWKPEWFQGEIDTLKKIKSAKVGESFASISLSVSPTDFADAFDDDGWKIIVEHFRIAAWIAKQSGLKGLMFDPEGYGSTVISSKSRKHPEKSFEEYAAKVRQRGREVMTAVAHEYPDMVFFTLFMNSGTALGALGGDPRDTMQGNVRYALYPAFVNGWLDAVPSTLTIVDGFEMAYPHSDEAQYLKHVNAIRNTTLALVAPENRLKYRGQLQAGLALYVDAYAGFPKVDAHADVFTDPPLKGRLVDRFREAASSALEAVDEYVWIYSEQYRWWPDAIKPEATRYWDEILPGATAALMAAKDPGERSLLRAEKEFAVAERKAAARGVPLRNLVKNGDFNNGAEKGVPPAAAERGSLNAKESAKEWALVPGSQGTAQRAIWGYSGYGSLALQDNGAVAQEVKASPFRIYRVRAWVRQAGKGKPGIEVFVIDAEGKQEGSPRRFVSEQSARDQWVRIEGTFKARANAAALQIHLIAREQESQSDTIWFDDVELFHVDVN
jgi:hypothetical protein